VDSGGPHDPLFLAPGMRVRVLFLLFGRSPPAPVFRSKSVLSYIGFMGREDHLFGPKRLPGPPPPPQSQGGEGRGGGGEGKGKGEKDGERKGREGGPYTSPNSRSPALRHLLVIIIIIIIIITITI